MIAKEKKKVPNLSFKGFTDDWEQRKLGEVADVKDGTHDSPRYINEGYPLLTSKNVGNGYINYDDVKYVSENDYVQINKRSKVDINDILMGMIGTIGNLALIREEPDFAIKNVALIKHTSNFDYQFLFQELQTSAISKELLSGMDGGTQKFVSLKKIRNLSVMLPSENEQKQIGAFFKQFDSLIALQQRKLDLLKQLKKGLLQKMFADKDSKQPILRFKGFHDDWEQRRLGEVAEIKTGSRNHQDSVDNGKYPFFIRSEKVERLNEYDFDTKAILVPGDGRIGEIFHYYDGKFALHQRVYKVDNFKEVNPLYLLNLFKYKFKKHALRLNAQGTVPSLRLPMFTNWNILIPNLNEQQKIGLFFQQLDSLITLQQRKQNHLKLLKKSLLQQMFI